MPNAWETQHGFNQNNGSDGSQDADGDGWTNLEEYLNNTNPGSGGVPLSPPINLRIVAND
jgi:hypothetical protein